MTHKTNNLPYSDQPQKSPKRNRSNINMQIYSHEIAKIFIKKQKQQKHTKTTKKDNTMWSKKKDRKIDK